MDFELTSVKELTERYKVSRQIVVNGKVNNGDRVDLIDEVASLRSLLEGLIGAIALNAHEGLPGHKRPSDVLSIQAVY